MDVRAILKISGGEAGFATTSGGVAPIPGITLGVITRLILDMRAEGGQDDVELPSIPAADLAGCDSYYIAIDNDWSQGTAPKMARTSGISIVEEGGRTLFQAELPNTAAIAGLADAIEAAAAKSITLNCEIGGTKAGTGDVFAYNFSLVIRNRIWLPDGSPEDLPSDPDYLNTVQATALINATVAAAIEGITGDPGPAPTITLGTVTSGATASATLTPGAEDGEYTLDLVLPQGTPGDEGEMPVLAVGTVTEGEAAAEIVAGEGGYTLNLTVPRGLPGAGVTPSGIWAVGTTYALNDAVRYNGGWWRSLQAGNTGHTPPVGTDGDAWWEIIVKDGIDAEPFLRVYNDTDDVDDPDWHAEFQPGDTHFRDSVDGGATWTAPAQVSIAHDVIVLFNIDATTDWTALTPGVTYSTGTGAYMRARQEGGAWGAAYQIHELESQALRVQFSAGGASPTWHAVLEAGDTQARFYNTLATIDVTVTISDGTFDVAEIQLCPIADPWHASYVAGDRYRKFSMDGGQTYGLPIPLYGKSAYEEWLDLGNTGTKQDFIDSLKGEPGDGEGGTATPLSNSNPLGLGLAAAGISAEAARADHVHPVTGLVLASEKGAVLGVASLGADGLVPASQLPVASGGAALPITRQRFARPYFDQAMHLVIQAAAELDFSDAETIIDTENNAADRAKVISYTGFVLTPCPVDGFGGAFSGQPVFVDLSALTEVTFLRYKWTAADGDSDWYVTFFPSNGEAYVAPPAGISGETPAPTTFGTLKVDIAGALTGQWSADGGSTWHDSGDTITVATGTHTVTFAYVDGYTTPSSQSVTISDGFLTTVSAEYYEIEVPTETEGTLVVNITGASNGSWSIDSGTTWKSSGQSLLLTAGSYTITFEPILGYSKPDDIPVTVVAGNITVKSGAYVEQPYSANPTDYGMTWDNGTEPVLEEGNKVIFVTPTGAGNFSGDSWANAKAGLYTAGLAASNGDVLYLQEGTYPSHLAPVAATKSIGIYGGFTVAGGTWETRDGFAHPSIIDASSNPSVPFIKPESGVAQAVNGIACTGFTGGVMLANGGTATVKNCAIYHCQGMVSSHAVENCLVLDCTGGTGAATDCVFVNLNTSSGNIVTGNATDCIFLNCSVNNMVYGSASGCEFENCETNGIYGHVKDDAEDCTFTNCSCSSSSSSNSYIVGNTATNCTFTNCSSSSSNSYIVVNTATNCTFTNCSCSSSGSSFSYIVMVTATNCTFTNCSCSSSGSSNSYIVGSTATNCTFTNCSSGSSNSYIVGTTVTNCTISRCVASRLTNTPSGYKVTNSIIWNSTITTVEFGFGSGTNNAASTYVDANTLVLGTDNTLAKFADLGTVSAIGYSESLNDTPAADFGDFRPQAGSVLIGAGVAVFGITEDIEGNTRPDPPTIGAYEYVEDEPDPGYLVEGAGLDACNGLYVDSGQTHEGKPVFVHDSSGTNYYLYYQKDDDNDYCWVIHTSVDNSAGGDPDAIYNNSVLTGVWSGYSGNNDPAPSVTAQGAVWQET